MFEINKKNGRKNRYTSVNKKQDIWKIRQLLFYRFKFSYLSFESSIKIIKIKSLNSNKIQCKNTFIIQISNVEADQTKSRLPRNLVCLQWATRMSCLRLLFRDWKRTFAPMGIEIQIWRFRHLRESEPTVVILQRVQCYTKKTKKKYWSRASLQRSAN